MVLKNYHYLNTPLPPHKYIYTIRPKKADPRETLSGFSGPAYGHASLIGVIVYSTPLRDLQARTKATRGYFKQPATMSERLKLLNKNVLYVSRLVMDPRYRRLGLADWLWRETLQLQTVPMVESLTPLPMRKEWLKSLGFELFYNRTPDSIRKVKNALTKAHITGSALSVPQISQKRIDCLLSDERIKLEHSLHEFLSKYRSHEHMPKDLQRMMFILSKIPYPNGYLIWLNPHIDYNPVRNWIEGQHVQLDINRGYVPAKSPPVRSSAVSRMQLSGKRQ